MPPLGYWLTFEWNEKTDEDVEFLQSILLIGARDRRTLQETSLPNLSSIFPDVATPPLISISSLDGAESIARRCLTPGFRNLIVSFPSRRVKISLARHFLFRAIARSHAHPGVRRRHIITLLLLGDEQVHHELLGDFFFYDCFFFPQACTRSLQRSCRGQGRRSSAA